MYIYYIAIFYTYTFKYNMVYMGILSQIGSLQFPVVQDRAPFQTKPPNQTEKNGLFQWKLPQMKKKHTPNRLHF